MSSDWCVRFRSFVSPPVPNPLWKKPVLYYGLTLVQLNDGVLITKGLASA